MGSHPLTSGRSPPDRLLPTCHHPEDSRSTVGGMGATTGELPQTVPSSHARLRTRPAFRALLLALALLAVPACGGQPPPGASLGSTSSPTSQHDGSTPTVGEEPGPETPGQISTEGSVKTQDGKFVEYPDGFKISFLKAQVRPDSKPAFDGDPDTSNRVRITLLLENTGTAPITINSDLTTMKAYGGANRFELNLDPGFAGSQEARNDKPHRLSPGTTFEVYETFNIPADKRGEIAVSVNDFPTFTPSKGDAYTQYTFADIQDVLRT